MEVEVRQMLEKYFSDRKSPLRGAHCGTAADRDASLKIG